MLFVARGTSDHAALYGNYLVQTCLGIPAASASPSVVSLYSAQLDLRDVLVVAVSQSGESPDLVSFLEMARSAGATTLVITNAPDSSLGRVGDEVVDVRAGRETAVAATKSYTAQLLVLAALFGSDDVVSRLAELPSLGERVLGASGGPVAPPRDRVPVRRAGHDGRSRLLVGVRPRGGAEADGDLVHLGTRPQLGGPAARPGGAPRPVGAAVVLHLGRARRRGGPRPRGHVPGPRGRRRRHR